MIRLVAMLLMIPMLAQAGRVSRSRSGTADCPTKAWRVLFIGGERQANSWCNSVTKNRRQQVREKRKRERVDYKRKKDDERRDRKRKYEERRDKRKAKDQAYRVKRAADKYKREERKAKYEAQRARREAYRLRREARYKARHGCLGIGKGAGCTKKNPGKWKGVSRKAKR